MVSTLRTGIYLYVDPGLSWVPRLGPEKAGVFICEAWIPTKIQVWHL
jgi:hypothetical protein